MIKKILVSLILVTAARLSADVQVGYLDWLMRSNPGPPPSGSNYMRMYANYPDGVYECWDQSGFRCTYDDVGEADFKTTSYTISTTDNGKLLVYNSSSAGTFTLPVVSTAPPYKSFMVAVKNYGTGTLSISPATLTIDGSGTPKAVAQGAGFFIYNDGSNYITMGGNGGTAITLKTNGTNNGSQTVLNIAGGTGITATDNGTGTVTLAASGGAAHGLGMAWGQSGGTTLTTGTSSYSSPFTCTIGATWYAYSNGTITFDVLKNGSSIVASAHPSAAAGSSSGSTSTWTTSVSVGDLLGFAISSASGSPTEAAVTLTCN